MAKIKSKINFVIDVLMFLSLAALAGIGFLMKYILIPGKDRFLVYGRNVELYVGGMDRHQWGIVHLIVGFTMLGLLALHIYLHWKSVILQFKAWVNNRNTRWIITVLFVFICFLLVYIPFKITPEFEEFEGRGRYSLQKMEQAEPEQSQVIEADEEIIPAPVPEEDLKEAVELQETSESGKHEEHDPAIDIRGFMTLKEVSVTYDVPVEYLRETLGLPGSIPENETFGRLRRQYSFTMSNVRDAIEKYRQSQKK